MLTCQALEIIYYLKFGKPKIENFKNKVVKLYKDFYEFNFQDDTANIIRIIRNNVAHAGTITGISSRYEVHNKEAVKNFLTINKLRNIRLIAFSFNLLVDDIVIRILGLDINDLSRNGLQPFNNKYFKK